MCPSPVKALTVPLGLTKSSPRWSAMFKLTSRPRAWRISSCGISLAQTRECSTGCRLPFMTDCAWNLVLQNKQFLRNIARKWCHFLNMFYQWEYAMDSGIDRVHVHLYDSRKGVHVQQTSSSYCTYPLLILSRNSLLLGSSYSRRSPSSMLNPFFHIRSVMSTYEQNTHMFRVALVFGFLWLDIIWCILCFHFWSALDQLRAERI